MTEEKYSDIPETVFDYKRFRSRGRAIIISNDDFYHGGLNLRQFSCLDKGSLFKALKFVGFRDMLIDFYDNLTALEMLDKMKKAAKEDYSEVTCLFVALLSHGDEKYICGTDKPVSYATLMEPLKASTTLLGKPKLFIVQACKTDTGGKYEGPILGPPNQRFSIENDSDMLMAYSTFPGAEQGSPFIQAFCEVMLRDGRRLEIMQILSRVIRIISFKPGTRLADKEKESPCIISKLRKALYFE